MKLVSLRLACSLFVLFSLLATLLTPSSVHPHLALASGNTSCQLTWQNVTVSPAGSDPVVFEDLTFVPPNQLWATGLSGDYPEQQNLMLRAVDSNWSVSSTPNEPYNEDYYMAGSAPNDVWASDVSEIWHWDGQSWTLSRTLPYGDHHAIVARAPNDAWIVGNLGTMFALHWDGMRWQAVHAPKNNLPTIQLNAITSIAFDNAWAVGSAGDGNIQRGVILHWDGRRWHKSKLPSSRGMTLSAISAVNANDIWVVGSQPTTTGAHALLLHWNGRLWKQWNAKTTPSLVEGVSLISVATPAHDSAWAVGYMNAEGPGGTAIVLHWDGSQWQKSATPTLFSPKKIVSLNSNRVLVETGTQILGWDGTSWEYESLPQAGKEPNA